MNNVYISGTHVIRISGIICVMFGVACSINTCYKQFIRLAFYDPEPIPLEELYSSSSIILTGGTMLLIAKASE